jgi:glycosyltransferase involved in cell wall biosynthesis
MAKELLLIHATHEAGMKFGGIGAVLDGLLGSTAYNAGVDRTILVGPFDSRDTAQMRRLNSSGNRLEVVYSSSGLLLGSSAASGEAAPHLIAAFTEIEEDYGVRLLYGRRTFGSSKHEVLLVDGSTMNMDSANRFKGRLYEAFGLQSDRYEHDPEFRYYINAAEPSWSALQALVGDRGYAQRYILAHEFMGLPLVFAGSIHREGEYRSLFYAHEVATVRSLLEQNLGYDTRFYNVLNKARGDGLFLEDAFGDQSDYFKHALITRSVHCDGLFAVGDLVVDELSFLGRAFATRHIDLVYNGVPSLQMSLEEKRASKVKLQRYAERLLGLCPDYVFSHVTRLVPSKGLWRDIRVLEPLDRQLTRSGQTAVLFILSTVIPTGRPAQDVVRMEQEYGWPVVHREGWPDLVSHEIPLYHAVEAFNRWASSSQIVLVNQFGWSQERCGMRMPVDMEFLDLRRGTDVEFGLSTYEPFGIAQLEPLAFGALCVLSSSCGSVGFLKWASGEMGQRNVLVADYLAAASAVAGGDWQQALRMGQSAREEAEAQVSPGVASAVLAALPRSEVERRNMLQAGYELSQRMSWEVVAERYFLPALLRLAV